LRARLLHRIRRAGPGAGARTGRLRSKIGAAIGDAARWVRVDPWDTGFVDLTPVHDRTGPARLLDVVAGRSAAALASWLSAQTADFAQRVQVVAMDGWPAKTAAA
jgi:transposase